MNTLLLTGGGGFLGRNIVPILKERYDVVTCGATDRNDIRADLTQGAPDLNRSFDLVLHAAGKAHSVPKTAEEKKRFFDVNYQGTVNLCRGLERAGLPKAFVFISTVAVYGFDYDSVITEAHPLDGDTPYAKSKILAEKFLLEWCEEHGVVLSILRPSLLVGKDAPGNLGAMVKGIRKGFYINIGGGNVRKGMLMAEDIARLVPLVAHKGGIYNVCDSERPTFGEVANSIAGQLGKRPPMSIPYWMAWCAAKVGDLLGKRSPINSYKLKRITNSLNISNAKACKELGWTPLNVLENFKV